MKPPAPTCIEIGQVWRHHSTDLYGVVGFDLQGRVLISRADSMQARPVWPDYLRDNFVLVVPVGRDPQTPHA